MKQYYRHKIEDLLMIRKIITIHYFEFDRDFCSEGESHDFWELVYADKAPIICRTGDEEIVLNEGEILFHKPNEFHKLSANGVAAPNVFIISFECKSEAIHFFENRRLTLNRHYLRYIYMIIEESRRTFDLPYSDPNLKKMVLLEKPTLGGMQLIRDLLEILLINVMRDALEEDNGETVFLPDESYETHLSEEIINYLKANLHKTIRIEDICDAMHYNKSYLFRSFKADTGQTIMHYLTGLRITEAKRLLRETDLSVGKIAEDLAFDTANYFAKSFRKTVGCTPSAYRRRAAVMKK